MNEPEHRESRRPLRISDRSTFVALRSGRRVRGPALAVSWLEGTETEPVQFAYAISRAVGHAVVRNRLRRRLREVVRSVVAHLPPGAYLISAAPMAANLSFEELREALTEALSDVTSADYHHRGRRR